MLILFVARVPLLLRVLCWWRCCLPPPLGVAFVASACALLFCFSGGGCCPVPAAVPAHLAVFGAVLFLLVGCVPSLSSALCCWCCLPPPPRSLPWWFLVVFVKAAPFMVCFCLFPAFLFLVSRSSCPCRRPPCGVCAAVLFRAGVLVLFGSLMRCVVSLLAVLFAACSAGFFFGPCVPCFLVRCCALLLSLVCGALCQAANVSECLVRC